MSKKNVNVLAATAAGFITLSVSGASFAAGKCMDKHDCAGKNKCATAEHDCAKKDTSCKGEDQLVKPTTEAACKKAGGHWVK